MAGDGRVRDRGEAAADAAIALGALLVVLSGLLDSVPVLAAGALVAAAGALWPRGGCRP